MYNHLNLYQDRPQTDHLLSVIREHGEDMLIFAYSLTQNAKEANQVVERVIIHLQSGMKRTNLALPLHIQLYQMVSEAFTLSAEAVK